VLGVASLKRGALVDEQTPLEPFPQKRDTYSHAKLRQELLFREYESKYGFELVVLRPGVIYGPGGAHLSARLGLSTFGVFLDMGGRNKLPLTFVDNCANAIVVAGTHKQAAGQAFHVHDEDIITCRAYLRRYRKQVRKFPSLRVPYPLLWLLAWCLEKYNALSRGQLPSILTRYKVANLWGGNRFDNRKLKSLGWEQLIPTSEALNRTFEAYRRDIESVHEN
jgi:nucleoside-diphosphate-sugar epimerase